MLDRVSPRQFDEWIAFRQIEPDPDDRLRTIMTTGLLALCRSWGMEIEPEDLDPVLAESLVQQVTPNQAAQMAGMAYGF